MRDGLFASHRRVNDKSDSETSEFSRHGIDELSRQGINERRCSIENLRTELNNELRAQQAMFLSARDEFETRQADTLANAWAVFEHSIANMKSPSAANSPKDNEVQTNSNDDKNRRSASGNALLDVASVPLVYPPSELGRLGIPYELGGQGIPVMIPGGMPSGVPRSVYLTPVDAMNQQFGNRYCSRELFSPVESTYYTAPNTCLRVRTPNWSTEATPGNSQSQNEVTLSQERTEADSGLGRTGSGYSLSNSRLQREELGDEQTSTFRPSPKLTVTASSKTVKHASFEDDKKVLLFGTSELEDQPDKNDKGRASSEKNSESRNEKSAKRKSADQPEKTRKSRSKQSASSDKVNKGEREQSANKERPCRSRLTSRRCRASRSRSASSTSGKRPVSSSKKVKKREQKDDMVVPESSTESDSDELSDKDESIIARSKHVLEPPKFDGRSSFETFWAQFENCASHNQWSRAQQLVYLKNALEKDAANVLWDYGKEVIDSLTGLTKTLKMRFGGEKFAEKNRIELQNRQRSSGESLTDLHIDIMRLSTLAYPDTDHKMRELISCDYFIDALADPELGLKIRERQPKDLDSALQIAL